MKYKINVDGMHCSGCKGLVTMSLEDAGMQDVEVSLEENTAKFDSEMEKAEVEKKVVEVFEELKEYKYSNLIIIK